MIYRILFPALICLIISCQQDQAVEVLPDLVDFNLHIRPILSNNCYVCHGPDISSRQADLRLDLEAHAKARTATGHRPIVEGNARRSEIYRRINSDNPDLVMPPPETNRLLTSYEKALIARWIDQGAAWKKHWAFLAPIEVIPGEPGQHRIDAFIDQTLTQQHLTRSGQASNPSLARRLSFVLTGLPPQPEDLKLNLEDHKIYEDYTDRLLASPQFGERWARHWMDLARYAEGRGHEFDYPVIGAWHYRDYLIRAFNENIPYDVMVKEQLAGDLLVPPRFNREEKFNESILGTLFINLGEGKHSPVDTRDEEKIRIDNVIDVTTKTFQGLTVACARCHDHKFDDIPTTDYYALYGIFESTRTHLYPPFITESIPANIDSIKNLKEELRNYLSAVSQRNEKSKASFISKNIDSFQKINYQVLGDFRGKDFGTWTSNGWCFDTGTTLDDVVVDPKTNQAKIIATGTASSQKISRGLSGALRSPTFTIDQDYILFKAAGNQSSFRIVLDNLQLIQDPIHGDLSRVINNAETSDYISYVGMWKGSKAYIEIMPGKYFSKNGKGHYYQLDPDAWIEVSYVLALDSLISFPSDKLVPESKTVTDTHFVKIPEPMWRQYLSKLNQYALNLQDTTFIAGVTDGDAIHSPVFIRGDHKNLSTEKIPHRFLTALPDVGYSFPTYGSGRLALAESITDPSNPLTSRVMVNRVWHHLFGKGIVSTVDNFGLQGTLPSHFELLDHLALQFISGGWSVKELIKYIVHSETFKQSTHGSSEAGEIDPENKLLHSFPVRRLEAEAIRDHILACSGQLDLTMYGPSIPLHLTDFLQGRGRPSVSGPLDGAGRRSIYQAVWRNFLPPFMTTFDMPIPFSTFGDRSVTNVPAQSLTLLNDPFVQQQAALWAEKLCQNHPSEIARIEDAYIHAFSRHPTSAEIQLSQEFLSEQKMKYEDSETDIEKMIWTDFCHSLFNMKEFIYLL